MMSKGNKRTIINKEAKCLIQATTRSSSTSYFLRSSFGFTIHISSKDDEFIPFITQEQFKKGKSEVFDSVSPQLTLSILLRT